MKMSDYFSFLFSITGKNSDSRMATLFYDTHSYHLIATGLYLHGISLTHAINVIGSIV